jgi:hypothetical protein
MRRAFMTALVLAAGCDSIDDPSGLDEPFVVQASDLKQGDLPEGVDGPKILAFASTPTVIRPGARAVPFGGNATDTAYSVGVRFAELGSGYWIRPAGSLDPIVTGERTWQMPLDANPELEPGNYKLEIVAFDEKGKPGPKSLLPVCVSSLLPDNLNACNPKAAPPLVIASLTWDADADLDLSVIAPDGTQFGRSKRSLSVGGKVVARLDADGTVGCVADGRRMENFSWADVPPQVGSWSVYANLYDACGKAAVTYTLTLYQRVTNGDGTFALQPIKTIEGDFVRQQANGGGGSAVFVTSVEFSP